MTNTTEIQSVDVEDNSINTAVDNGRAEKINLFNGEALEVMDKLISQGVKVDAIITDPPYGTITKDNAWDIVIPFDEMWLRLDKLLKPNGVVVLFGNEPFSSNLRNSNMKDYKYEWIWKKAQSGNYKAVKTQPRKNYENVIIFSKSSSTYNHQRRDLADEVRLNKFKKLNWSSTKQKPTLEDYDNHYVNYSNIENVGYPKAVLEFSNQTAECHNMKRVHPTQKPIPLMEYLVNTYSNEGELVLDFTMGSGSTGVACKNLKRDFIGIELDKKFFDTAKDRISNTIEGNSLSSTKTEDAFLERIYRLSLKDKSCELDIVNKQVDSLLNKRAIGKDLDLWQNEYNLSEDELYKKPMEKTGLSKRTLQRYKAFAVDKRFDTFLHADYEKLARKSLNGVLEMISLSDSEDFTKAANGDKSVFKKAKKKPVVNNKVVISTKEEDKLADINDSENAIADILQEDKSDNINIATDKSKAIKTDYSKYLDILTAKQCVGLEVFTKDESIEFFANIIRELNSDIALTNVYGKTKTEIA